MSLYALTFTCQRRGAAAAVADRLMEQGISVDRIPRPDGSQEVIGRGSFANGKEADSVAAEAIAGISGATYTGHADWTI